jgi:endonuclease YncB( thermonuclease family)
MLHPQGLRGRPRRHASGARGAWPFLILGGLAWVAFLILWLQGNMGGPDRTGQSDGQAPAGAERVRVDRVIDGDTLELSDGRMVRVLGIDAPETSNPNLRHPQALGEAATARLRELVGDGTVALERDQTDTDHYGRRLRHVWAGGRLVAATLAREGLAHAMSIPPDERHAELIRQAEAEAKAARRGLWSLARPSSLPVFGTPAP